MVNFLLFTDGDFTLIENLCDSRILTVNVHMIGENENDMTRLLNQSIITEHHETPLEIHLRLKVLIFDTFLVGKRLFKYYFQKCSQN